MMKEAAERRLEVAALRQRLRQTLAAIEEGGANHASGDGDEDEDDPRVVARRLAYLEDNQEALLAATIMQRGWRYFKYVAVGHLSRYSGVLHSREPPPLPPMQAHSQVWMVVQAGGRAPHQATCHVQEAVLCHQRPAAG